LIWFQGGENDQAGSFFIVAGEVIKIVFLRKNVGLRNFFAAGESPENDRTVDLSGDPGPARGVNVNA
jgi:hypothetical protein